MPTPSGELVYSHRVPYADTIRPGIDTTLVFELVRDGVGVVPNEIGKMQVVARSGEVLFEATPLLIAGTAKVGTVVPGATSESWGLGELFQTRWNLKATASSQLVPYRRPAVVATFLLVPPITDFDLTVGVYPDLIAELSSFAETGDNGEATLQPYIDEAWNVILRALFKVNRWPDLLFSVEDLVEPVRERSWERIFKFLFQKAGEGSKWETLWREHRDNAKTEWGTLSARFDNDLDGLPDSEKRDAVAGAIHQNAAPRRVLRGRW